MATNSTDDTEIQYSEFLRLKWPLSGALQDAEVAEVNTTRRSWSKIWLSHAPVHPFASQLVTVSKVSALSVHFFILEELWGLEDVEVDYECVIENKNGVTMDDFIRQSNAFFARLKQEYDPNADQPDATQPVYWFENCDSTDADGVKPSYRILISPESRNADLVQHWEERARLAERWSIQQAPDSN